MGIHSGRKRRRLVKSIVKHLKAKVLKETFYSEKSLSVSSAISARKQLENKAVERTT